MRKSIKIGKKGENDVAEMLRQWWNDPHFIRNWIGSSGAVATSQANSKHIPPYVLKALCGDIMTPIDFPFSVEVKNYKTLNVQKELTKKAYGKIGKFWSQCAKDAERAEKEPLLIVFSDVDYPIVVSGNKYRSDKELFESNVVIGEWVLVFHSWDSFSKLYTREILESGKINT